MVLMNGWRMEKLEQDRELSRKHEVLKDLLAEDFFRDSRSGSAWKKAIRRVVGVSEEEMATLQRKKARAAEYELRCRRELHHSEAESIERLEKAAAEELAAGSFGAPPTLQWIGEAIEHVECLEPALIRHLQDHDEDLQKVPWEVLEHLVAEFYAREGWLDVRLVGRDQRTGADVFVSGKRGDPAAPTLFIEVKQRTQGKLGIEVVGTAAGMMWLERSRYGWDRAVIIAPSGFKRFRQFTPESLHLLGVDVLGGEEVRSMLASYVPNDRGLYLPNPKRNMPSIGPGSDASRRETGPMSS